MFLERISDIDTEYAMRSRGRLAPFSYLEERNDSPTYPPSPRPLEKSSSYARRFTETFDILPGSREICREGQATNRFQGTALD